MSLQELRPTCDFLQRHLQEPDFFLVHEWRVSQETRFVQVLAPTCLFLRGSHKWKQYQEKTSLHTWGVRQRAIQVSQPVYSALTWRHEHKPQGPQRWQWERDAEWSALTNACHTHCAPRQLGTTADQRYDIPQDWLWDTCHMAGVHWGTRCEGCRSKEGLHYRFERSARNPLERDQVQVVLGNHPEAVIGKQQSTLFTSLDIPWGFLTRAVLLCSAGFMSRKKVELEDFCE